MYLLPIYSTICKVISIPFYLLGESPKQQTKDYYKDLYFDSSDSGSEGEGTADKGTIRNVGKKVCKLSNDELFYDPGMDAEDERWVNRQRMAYHNG